MSDDPFESADPVVVSLEEGDIGTCPCGWRSDHLFPGRRAARADLDRHLRTEHPERRA